MAARKKPEEKQSSDPERQQVRFFVEPGKKFRITVDVGEEAVEGKLPLTIQIDPIETEGQQRIEIVPPERKRARVPFGKPKRWKAGLEALERRLQAYDLATWLFLATLVVYLGTRLIGLTQFPIYFFTDEAVQSQSMIDLIHNGYRDTNDILFPTYFRNGEYYNLGLSVYLQWLPSLLFGKSAAVTRATSVLVTLLAAISVGLVLRDIFKLKYWWTGPLLLSITPAWFLHSRTAFETAEFVALYAGTLCAYLFYRYKTSRYFYLALFLGALSFYTYSPAQLIVPLTALGLLLSDWRYHWQNRHTVLFGLGLGIILALPYVRSSLYNPNAPFAHLHTLWSYWYQNIPFSQKIARYLSEFGVGLSPWYWYAPNGRDLSRHLMKGYGNILIASLPFALLGLAQAIRNLRMPAWRTVLIALMVSPAAAALVQVSITRSLVLVIPAAILTASGLEGVLRWIQDPGSRLAELQAGPGLRSKRVVAALVLFMGGLAVAFLLRKPIDRLALVALVTLLALQTSGVLERFAQSLTGAVNPSKPALWKSSPRVLALTAFVILAGANVLMLNDALRHGPLWFRDYGMGGMQYGAFQIFDIIEAYQREHPETKIIFSPDWANGADLVARFFLHDPDSIQMGSVRGHITQKLPLDENTLFIMTPQEFEQVLGSEKLAGVQVERIIPYPDGQPGFYFIRLRYADNVDEIFAAENAVRQALQESTVTLDGQEVKLRFSYLDSDFQAQSMALVFDNDPYTVTKTFESNPFRIEMTFPQARTLNGFSIIIGSAKVQVTLKCSPEPGATPIDYVFEGQGTRTQPKLAFDLPASTRTQVLQVEVLDLLSPAQAKVHIWELELR